MRILDIDLDFFLSDVACCPGKQRLEQENIVPWTEQRVRFFLETQCGLDKNNPLPGKFVEQHDEVFYNWRSKIHSGKMRAPFEVVHVDAHADLGLGDASYKYIMTEHLGQHVSQRDNPPIGNGSGVTLGNYLVFAISCQWISSLTYVCLLKDIDDIPDYHMKNHDSESGYVQLKYYGQVDNNVLIKGTKSPLSLEPEVPFKKVLGDQFKNNQEFDRIYLAQSPTYTPESSDALIPIIMEYIKTD